MKGLETFVDWFAGVGGFRLAGESSKLKCVGACDNDKYARQTYAARFGHEPEFSDAWDVIPSEVPDHDLFCGGFPCPAFSIAGKRQGFQDERGQLIFAVGAVLEAKRPNYVLLENVLGLLTAPVFEQGTAPVDGTAGWVFYRILEMLGDLGYTVQWHVLYSRHWVPQDRRRVYILASRRELPIPEVFPLFDFAEEMAGNVERVHAAIGRVHSHQGGRVYGPNSIIPTLTAGDKGPFVHMNDGRHLRLVTPLEKERLQGFPEEWTEGVSDSQRMKQCGNAITVQAATEVIRRLVECHGNQGKRLETEAIG